MRSIPCDAESSLPLLLEGIRVLQDAMMMMLRQSVQHGAVIHEIYQKGIIPPRSAIDTAKMGMSCKRYLAVCPHESVSYFT